MADGQSDAELVRAILAGGKEAFGELVARYKDAVFGVAFHRLGDFEDARDAAQEAFVKAYLSLSKLRQPTAFPYWLCRIANGTALDVLRRKHREVPLEAADRVPARRPCADPDLARQVKEALAALSESTRLAVILHYVNGYSHAEVASFIGATPGAVKTRLSRARGRLREEMIEIVEDRLKEESGVFVYEATDESGRVITGTTEARSASAVRRRLTERGYRVGRMKRDRRTPKQRAAEDGEPVKRVAQAILEQALKDKATEIRIALRRSKPEATLGIRYLIGKRWHLVMVVPRYVWAPLRGRLAGMAGVELEEGKRGQSGTICFDFRGRDTHLKATLNAKSIRIELPPPA